MLMPNVLVQIGSGFDLTARTPNRIRYVTKTSDNIKIINSHQV